MAAFDAISSILGKFSPAQRLTALILVLLTIISISIFQFIGDSKPECETLQEQLVQTQTQLTSTISSQSTFIQTIDDLRKKTFDLNTEISRKDSIIFAMNKYNTYLEKNMIASVEVDHFEIEPLRMVVEPETSFVVAASRPEPILNNPNQYEETSQINLPIPTPDSINFVGIQDTTSTADTVVSKGKIPWIRRVLGRKH